MGRTAVRTVPNLGVLSVFSHSIVLFEHSKVGVHFHVTTLLSDRGYGTSAAHHSCPG
jgi:hypothetical protein